jgi:hypothetical protein
MRIATTLGFALLAICLIGATNVSAQVPNIAVYFDDINTEAVAICPGIILDTLYVVAQNVGTFINAIEYRIQYSPGSGYLAHIGEIPAAIDPYSFAVGSSPSGVSIGWGLPKNAFVPFIVQRVLVLWDCAGCGAQDVIQVLKHPATGFLGAVEFGTGAFIPCVGLTALICPVVATHDKTWGAVKSLYRD